MIQLFLQFRGALVPKAAELALLLAYNVVPANCTA